VHPTLCTVPTSSCKQRLMGSSLQLVSGTGKAATSTAGPAGLSRSTEAAAATTTGGSASGGLIGSLVSSAKSDISSVAGAISTHLASATGSSSASGSSSSSGAGSVGVVENMGIWGFMGGVAVLAAAAV